MCEKYSKLLSYIRKYKNCAILYSGGVDSFFLLYAAMEALGKENVFAITIKSQFVSSSEFEIALEGIKKLNSNHYVVDVDILNDPDVIKNDKERCYYCKKNLLFNATKVAESLNASVIFDGTNASDKNDYRPGTRALREGGIISPLKDAGLTKAEIIEIMKSFSLNDFVRPADACLATRIPTDTKITLKDINMIGEAEDIIKKCGVSLVRVRKIGDNALIELYPNEIKDFKNKYYSYIMENLINIGFKDVLISDDGYKRGNMNIF